MKKLLFFILGILFLEFFSLHPVMASVLFQENFDNYNTQVWEETLGYQGNWTVLNGVYAGKVYKAYDDNPTYSINGNTLWENYRFDVKIRGDLGVDKIILFRFNSLTNTYAIKLCSSWWDWYGDRVTLLKNDLINGGLSGGTFVNTNGNWYKLSVEVDGGNIKLFINDSVLPVINYTDSNPIPSGRIGLLVWPGGYGGGWTVNSFDDILVTSIDLPNPTPTPTDIPTSTPTPTDTPTPTPTLTPSPTPSPTPTSTPLSPIVIIPGLGGSWNSDEIIHGQNKPQPEWYKPFFVNTYDGVIKTLENSGYKINDNLFVFYYDCFQPVEKSAEDLKNYINDVVKPNSGVKINLVGHSLGGLVGRTYVQNNPNNNVNKLITLGTPHLGVVQAYKAWEGADLNGLLSGVEKIGAELLLQLRSLDYPNQVKAVQNIVPAFKDILFTNNYLKNQNGTIKPEPSLNQQNTWLKILGLSPKISEIIHPVIGTNIETPRWFTVKPRNLADRLLGRWEDGKPISQENSSGDKTVLEESAKINNANLVTLNGVNHSDLVKSSNGQQKILDILGLTTSQIVPVTDNFQEPALVFALASPAYFKVIAPYGKQIGEYATGAMIPNALYSSSEKIIIIPNNESGNYRIEVTGTGLGEYKLIIGQLNSKNDVWTIFKGSGNKNFEINIDNSLKSTPKFLITLINTKLNQLISELPKKHPRSIFAGIIKFRLEKIREGLKTETFNNNKKKDLQIKIIENVIKETDNAINFAQLKNFDSFLPQFREIMNLLAEVYDLLELNNH